MRKGVWHQCGDRSQRLSLEQIEEGVGVGVVVSPRDLGRNGAETYARDYREAGADVAVDPQFHVVGASPGHLGEWDFNALRTSTSTLGRVSTTQLDELTIALRSANSALGTAFVIAPSLVYESGRRDLVNLNRKLFGAAKRAGDELGIPTIATVVIGRSAGSADAPFYQVLSDATSVPADGWYYSFEFGADRIPNDAVAVQRAASGCLVLAAGGLPVFQAFAGPLALVGAAAGATAVGVGHSQNLWRFTRERWLPPAGSGGGGNAPARLFSRSLWATVVYPDEIALLSENLASLVVENSPFLANVARKAPFPNVPRWEAGKHLVWVIGDELQALMDTLGGRARCDEAIERLNRAVGLLGQVAAEGVELRDDSASYQFAWSSALTQLGANRATDFDTLDLLA